MRAEIGIIPIYIQSCRCPREMDGRLLFYMTLQTHPAVEDFLAFMDVEQNASSGTIEGYREDLGIFLRFLGSQTNTAPEEVDLGQVTRSDIRRYLSYLKNERNNCPTTINRKLAILRSLFRFLIESEEWPIKESPVRGVPFLRSEKRLPVYLSLDEAELLLASVRQTSRLPERDYAIFLVFLQCGCRLSELLSLTLDSVDLKAGTLRIFGKGRKERIVPLTERTAKALDDYLRVRKPRVPTNALFLNNKGRPLQKSGLRYLFELSIKRSPLNKPNLTPHKLRHTCLTLLLQAGVDIRTLQEIAGHSDISTTQVYTHVTQDKVLKAMKKHPLG